MKRLCLLAAFFLPLASPIFAAEYADVKIADMPHVKQRPDFCGEACAEMVLKKLGKTISQDGVFSASGLDPANGRGCYTADLKRGLEQLGFKIGNVWYNVNVAKADEELEQQWAALHADLVKSIPSIVCMHADSRPDTTEHMRLIVGYDSKQDEVIYHEPAANDGAYRRMKRAEFLQLWPLKYKTETWLVIRFRMEAGALKEPPRGSGFSDADYAQHVMELKKKMPAGFLLAVQRPFVVVGDLSPEQMKRYSDGTVQWAVAQFKREYFTKEPAEIIDVWLFKDDASYRKYAKEVFGDTPTTPYGYYSARHRALIMNIATGGGTLVHEIVHPFVRANFPNCPAWLNEGMGSLYEQAGERNGHIIGNTNWRLAGLQRAIKEDRVPSFKTLTATSDEEFYGQDRGTNYAQARYLCYYLQENAQLHDFYHQFVANQKDDPTGYKTLVKILGADDMDAFQKKWQEYVMKLTFP